MELTFYRASSSRAGRMAGCHLINIDQVLPIGPPYQDAINYNFFMQDSIGGCYCSIKEKEELQLLK
jgi:hypothetical protein